jgi:hypothetical protein
VHFGESWQNTRHFLRLWPLSWAIAHSFGVPGWFTRPNTQYMFERHDQKLIFFCVYGRFRELLPIVLGFRSDLQSPWHSVHFLETWPKTHRFCIFGPFSWAIAHCFGVPEWFTRSMTLSTCLRGTTKNTSFLRFRAFFVSYCPQF